MFIISPQIGALNFYTGKINIIPALSLALWRTNRGEKKNYIGDAMCMLREE